MHATLRDTSNEDDVGRLFQAVYLALGYTRVGQDILGKRKGKSGIPDVRLLRSEIVGLEAELSEEVYRRL